LRDRVEFVRFVVVPVRGALAFFVNFRAEDVGCLVGNEFFQLLGQALLVEVLLDGEELG
jgi:hypothetical protein